jgi:hypothetical protein
MKRKIIIFGILMMLLLPVMNMVAANSPPENPTIEGPSSGTTGTIYTYKFCSNDPDGDDVSYCIDWDDGLGEICIGPFASGTCIEEPHSWSSDGNYVIKCKARDSNQAESEYTTLSISMPRTKQLNFPIFFEILFQKIPLLRILLL